MSKEVQVTKKKKKQYRLMIDQLQDTIDDLESNLERKTRKLVKALKEIEFLRDQRHDSLKILKKRFVDDS